MKQIHLAAALLLFTLPAHAAEHTHSIKRTETEFFIRLSKKVDKNTMKVVQFYKPKKSFVSWKETVKKDGTAIEDSTADSPAEQQFREFAFLYQQQMKECSQKFCCIEDGSKITYRQKLSDTITVFAHYNKTDDTYHYWQETTVDVLGKPFTSLGHDSTKIPFDEFMKLAANYKQHTEPAHAAIKE